MARFTAAFLNDNGDEVPFKASGAYDEATIEVDDPPEGEITVHELDAVLRSIGSTIKAGREVIIRRGGAKAFPGVITTPIGSEGIDLGRRFKVAHKGYLRLKRRRCLRYLYNGTINERDSRVVRPWDFTRLAAPGGALNTDGEEALAYGLPMGVIPQAIAGTRFAFIHDIRDGSIFRASGATSPGISTEDAQVYEDDALGGRAGLQRVQSIKGTFATGSPVVETIPLANGDPNVRAMGDINGVETLVLIGKRRGSEDPTVRVARNAGEGSRTWSSVTVTHVTTLDGVNLAALGLDAWELQTPFSFADAPTQKNQFGIEITLPGGSANASSIYGLAFVCDTDSDIGLTVGTVPAYADPDGNHDLEVADFDLTGKNGQQAMETWRRATTSDPAVNSSPHWDAWVDANLAVQVAERRGTDKAITLSKADKNIEVVEYEPYGDDLVYAVVGLAQGRGNAEYPIFDADLYDADRDPDVGALYGEVPQVIEYRPSGARTASSVRAAAKAFFKLYKDPQEYIRATVIPTAIPYYETGDAVQFKESSLGLNASKRVVKIRRSWDADTLEVLDTEFGERLTGARTAFSRMSQMMQANDRLPSGNSVTSGASGAGVFCDKDVYGRLPFRVPEGAERVFLDIETIPYQVQGRAVNISGITIAGEGAHTHDVSIPNHTHSVTIPNHTHSVPGSSHSHTVTGTTTDLDLVPGMDMLGITVSATTFPTSGWATVTAGVTLSAAQLDDMDYCQVFLFTWNDSSNAHDFFFRFRVSQSGETDKFGVGGSGGTSGRESGSGLTTDSVVAGFGVEAFDISQLNFSKSATFRIEVQSGIGSSFTDDAGGYIVFTKRHDHDVSGQTASATTPAAVTSGAGGGSTPTTAAGGAAVVASAAGSTHTHGFTGGTAEIDFGIYQYPGDGLDPDTEPPAYGEAIQWAVDASVDANGVPDDWATDRHPQTFGIRDGQHRFRIEVTDLVEKLSNGLPRPGTHFFYCLGAAYTDNGSGVANSQGLAAVSVTADYKFREVQG